MGIDKRLRRLEAAAEHGNKKPTLADEEAEKRHWLAVARIRRNDDTRDPDEFHANDIFRLLRLQGRLGATTEEVLAQLSAWHPPPGERAALRVIARAVYELEEGTQNMVCPPEWRESFEAADEVRKLYAAVPDETLARWAVMQHELEKGEGGDVTEKIDAKASEYGITDELVWKVLGPDAEEIPEDERARRLREILADGYYGERGYRVQKHIDRLGVRYR